MNINEQTMEALKDLIFKMADDQLIIGHRNSEWTGLAPFLEEDIAFSSMAQDKIGQANHLYELLSEMGEASADEIAFTRTAEQFHSNQLVEYPIGEYDFSIVRQFYFDCAELIRFKMLSESAFEPLSDLAKKYFSEIKYHVFHAQTWLRQLANGNEESKNRLFTQLTEQFPLALGIFEKGKHEKLLISESIFEGEDVLKHEWYRFVSRFLNEIGYDLAPMDSVTPVEGGRVGKHTEHLQPLLTEMTEVFNLDPSAEW